MSLIDSIFDVVDDDSELVSEPVPGEIVSIDDVEESDEPIGRQFAGLDTEDPASRWFSLCVLTVPDTTRFPVPERFFSDRVEVDLSNLAKLSGAECKALVTSSLPDLQLETILAAEQARDKPRSIVLRAIAAEQAERGDGYQRWVEAHAMNPWACRIAAIAWQCGDAEPVVYAPSPDEEDVSRESSVLRLLNHDWAAWRNSSGWEIVSGWELDRTIDVLRIRQAYAGIGRRGGQGLTWSTYVQNGVCGFCQDLVATIGGLKAAAIAVGLSEWEMPPIPSVMDVWREYQQSPGSIQLQDWVSGKLTLERDILSTLETVGD